uniref:U3 small nucleolar RNA-associated protein 11 n=3 Tax=Populus TaxID=3689 RepID=A0A4U5PMH3_POPAL|nr:U3 small nucleolar RNA-associated protein 11 [Populus alba]
MKQSDVETSLAILELLTSTTTTCHLSFVVHWINLGFIQSKEDFSSESFRKNSNKMSSLRNAIPRKAHKERAQPQARKKFGLLEKHKDYVARAKAFHKKEETLRRLKEKAASRNPDEFYFGMIKSKTVDGVHRPQSEANKYTQEELLLMKTQDIGYILQKAQSEKKKIEKLTATLHSLDGRPSSKHIYFAEDREEAKEIRSRSSENKMATTSVDVPDNIKRKIASSYRELEARKNRANQLEKIYMDMALKKELQKKGRKRKLREDEIVCPTTKPVFKWRSERKR